MPAPTAYTEATLKAFLHATLGPTAAALGWSVAGGSYDEALNETLLAYPVADIATVTGAANIRKLRALARVCVWQAVVEATAGHYDIRSDQTALTRSQINKQARENLATAQADAADYDSRYQVGVDTVQYIHDPYQYWPDELRTR